MMPGAIPLLSFRWSAGQQHLMKNMKIGEGP
jgi:hypothetical protein